MCIGLTLGHTAIVRDKRSQAFCIIYFAIYFLHQAGYEVVAKFNELINAKRFVCRAVDKIRCRVINDASLVSFIGDLQNSKKDQTFGYAQMEQQLVGLCTAGDEWVVALPGVPAEKVAAPESAVTETVRGNELGPCARDADPQKDSFGDTAALDEAGYQSVAKLSSPTNMKRFMCRVVEKIYCKVNNAESLAAFVPYYGSVAKGETYAHLEQELLEICQAQDKWASPL
jgi:hypothetical protein